MQASVPRGPVVSGYGGDDKGIALCEQDSR